MCESRVDPAASFRTRDAAQRKWSRQAIVLFTAERLLGVQQSHQNYTLTAAATTTIAGGGFRLRRRACVVWPRRHYARCTAAITGRRNHTTQLKDGLPCKAASHDMQASCDPRSAVRRTGTASLRRLRQSGSAEGATPGCSACLRQQAQARKGRGRTGGLRLAGRARCNSFRLYSTGVPAKGS